MANTYQFWFGDQNPTQEAINAQAVAYNLKIHEAIKNSDYFFVYSNRETDFSNLSTKVPTTKDYIEKLLEGFEDITVKDFNEWTYEGQEEWYERIYFPICKNEWEDLMDSVIASISISLEPYYLENDKLKGMHFIVDVTAYKN